MAAGIDAADLLRHAHSEAKGGVHGNGDGHEAGARRLRRVERLDGDIERFSSVAGPLEEGQRRGQRQWLMAELIAGDEQNAGHRVRPCAP